MPNVLPSVFALTILAVVAAWLTITRGTVTTSAAELRSTVRVAAIAVVVQASHFGEELMTGFHQRLPALFGLPPMSLGFFVSFNVVWLAIWTASAWGLARWRHVTLFPLWFLGVASVANGLLHPLLALNAGRYFPGLVTSPVSAIVGVLLVARLARVTA